MKLCWDKNPSVRPTMKQCHQWTSDVEFERLRAQIALGSCTAISCSCISRIEPQYESEWINETPIVEKDDIPTVMNGSLLSQSDIQRFSLDMEIIAPDEKPEIEESFVNLPKEESDSLDNTVDSSLDVPKDFLSPQTSSSSLHETKALTASLLKDSYTQIWMCGRDQKKGLLSVFIFPDNQKSISVSSYYF